MTKTYDEACAHEDRESREATSTSSDALEVVSILAGTGTDRRDNAALASLMDATVQVVRALPATAAMQLLSAVHRAMWHHTNGHGNRVYLAELMKEVSR